jgi:hypothetical protein
MTVYQGSHFEGPWYGGGGFPDADEDRIDSFFDVFAEMELPRDDSGGTIPIELVALELKSERLISVTTFGVGNDPPEVELEAESFFDAFVEIELPGADTGRTIPIELVALNLKSDSGITVTTRDPGTGDPEEEFHINSFFDVLIEIDLPGVGVYIFSDLFEFDWGTTYRFGDDTNGSSEDPGNQPPSNDTNRTGRNSTIRLFHSELVDPVTSPNGTSVPPIRVDVWEVEGSIHFPGVTLNASRKVTSTFNDTNKSARSKGLNNNDPPKVTVQSYGKIHLFRRGRETKTWGDDSSESFFDVTFELEGSVKGSINEGYKVSFEGSIELQNDVEKQFGDSVDVSIRSGYKLNTWVGVDDLNNSKSIINLTNWFKAKFNNTTNSSNDDLDFFRMNWSMSSEVNEMTGEDNRSINPYGDWESNTDMFINISHKSSDQMLVVLGFNVTIDNAGSGSDADSSWETSVGVSLNIEIADASVGTDQSHTIKPSGSFSNVKINVSFDSKAELVRSAEKHIVSLSSELWTDYEIHDPGITIMELLCYAITDLEYRDGTNFAFDSFFDINVAGIFSPGGWGFTIDSFFDIYVEVESDDDSSNPILRSELSMNLTVRTQDSNETNEESYKVKVKFPWVRDTDDEGETFWTRIGVLIGEGDFGSWFLPEVDDEVLVLFEQGDPRVPIVIGAIWKGKDESPELPEDFEVEVEYAEESRTVLKTYFSVDGNNITLNEIIRPLEIPGLDEYHISLDIDDLEAGIPPGWDLAVDYIVSGGSTFLGEVEEIIEVINKVDHAETSLAFIITTYELIIDPNTGREIKQAVAIDEIFVNLKAVYEEDPIGGKSSEVKSMTLEVRVNRIEMA